MDKLCFQKVCITESRENKTSVYSFIRYSSKIVFAVNWIVLITHPTNWDPAPRRHIRDSPLTVSDAGWVHNTRSQSTTGSLSRSVSSVQSINRCLSIGPTNLLSIDEAGKLFSCFSTSWKMHFFNWKQNLQYCSSLWRGSRIVAQTFHK